MCTTLIVKVPAHVVMFGKEWHSSDSGLLPVVAKRTSRYRPF